MGFVKQPPVPDRHVCDRPLNDWWSDGEYQNAREAVGTIWECDECHLRYKWTAASGYTYGGGYRPMHHWEPVKSNWIRKLKRHG